MKILGQKLNQDEFRNYVETYNFGSIKPDGIVIHHTWRPTKKDWNGEKSIMGLKNYYEGLGWSAAPHIFIAEDGIWLFTPMTEVGIHAGEGNAVWERLGRQYRGFKGPIGSKLKGYTIGIEVVGDYDVERWTGHTFSNALSSIRILMDTLAIDNEHVTFHRDWTDQKSCPGHAITKDWLFAELSKRDSHGSPKPVDVSGVSPWAKEAFDWQIENDLDRSVTPHQKVEAEWVFAMIKKYHDKFGK